jgi:hypothetical protein
MADDPHELVDLGEDAGYAAARAEMADRLFAWLRRLATHQTAPAEFATQWVERSERGGIRLGLW